MKKQPIRYGRATINRREFFAGIGASAFAASLSPLLAAQKRIPFSGVIPYTGNAGACRWFKGNTHMHTLRSDGHSLPIEAAALFKRDGYNFICFTDHNVTAAEPFIPIPADSGKGGRISENVHDSFKRDFPGIELCRTVKDAKGRICFTSASFEEIAGVLDEPERFLVIGGNEVSAAPTAGRELHCNLINYHKACRAANKRTVAECLDWIRDEYERVAGDAATSMLTLNHPLWVSYDIPPQIIAERQDIRFFEVCNSGSMPRFNLPGKEFTHDKWWDVVNTIRSVNGQPLIYGIACDDIHSYTAMRERKKRTAGYVQVLCERLSSENIVHAFYRGDFYASTGMNLEQVTFDPATRTLTVTADSAFGNDCRISFIGTKKGADVSVKEVVKWNIEGELNSWLEKTRHFSRQRTVERYSDEIGRVFKTATGRTASYTMQPDDLYVRAKIVSPANADTANAEPSFAIAWTQPISAI